MNKIILKNVTVGYNGNSTLNNINLEINNGIYKLLGRNGTGKTTLLRTISGILPMIEGDILINNEQLKQDSKIKDIIGYLGHKKPLIPSETVSNGIKFYASLIYKDKQECNKKIEEIIERYNLKDIYNKYVHKLSFGQIQRASIACIMLNKPKILLLDEPFNGLDPIYSDELYTFFDSWKDDHIIIFSTHDISHNDKVDMRLLMIKDKQLKEIKDKVTIEDF